MKDLIAIIIGLLLTTMTFGLVYIVPQAAPDNTIVYVDAEKKIYYAPPYVDNIKTHPEIVPEQPIDIKKLHAITINEAKSLNYTPDQVSKEKGYFVQKYRSFTGLIMEKLDIVKPLPSRWNKDGAWNW